MANLTIAVDDEVLQRARIRALELDTSVNAILREYLQSFAGSDRMDARRRLVEGAEQHSLPFGFGAREWSRDELHDRR